MQGSKEWNSLTADPEACRLTSRRRIRCVYSWSCFIRASVILFLSNKKVLAANFSQMSWSCDLTAKLNITFNVKCSDRQLTVLLSYSCHFYGYVSKAKYWYSCGKRGDMCNKIISAQQEVMFWLDFPFFWLSVNKITQKLWMNFREFV